MDAYAICCRSTYINHAVYDCLTRQNLILTNHKQERAFRNPTNKPFVWLMHQSYMLSNLRVLTFNFAFCSFTGLHKYIPHR
jgi:hypothetical protein